MSLETVDPGSDVYGEKAAFAELLAWSFDRPAWQRDALRRLVLNGALTDECIDFLLTVCLAPENDHEPLSNSHVAANTTTGEAISVVRLTEVTGVNALAPTQKLEFAKSGLSIIYGDNGSGKSGYVRILKHACRTRDRETAIRRDIEDVTGTAQSAKIAFARGAVDDHFDWHPAAAAHGDLSSVSIFDSRSANIHVEKTNAVAYIPQPMQILEALAAACDRVKAKLDAKLAELTAKTPLALKNVVLRSETAAGDFVRKLNAKSNLAQLELLATLSATDLTRLAALELDLSQEPKRAAALVNSIKSRLDEGAGQLKRLMDATADTAFTTRDTLFSDWQAKAEASKLASENLFKTAPLPEVGQATWRALWEAARKYSNEQAYPERAFPAPLQDELCVLCQQPLDVEAVARQSAFEGYIQSTTKVDEDSAARAYNNAVAVARSAAMSMSSLRQLRAVIAAELNDAELAKAVRAAGVRAAWRRRALLNGEAASLSAGNYPAGDIISAANSLSKRAAQLLADQTSPEHQALVRELYELKERQALIALVPDIKAEVERLKEAETIRLATKDTAKLPVTKKNKDISDKLVTNALRGRFAREIDKLKLSRMPVELRKVRDSNAASYFQVCLVEKPDEAVGEIFSEGEHRCVALAAFLAELVTSKQYSGIVFDDPMSSLDHIHRKAVAARLVEESSHRQVVVFTHDLTFLFELRREAEEKGHEIHYQTVSRKLERPGHIASELPMKAKSALHLANTLRSELKTEKTQFLNWSDTKRTIFCKGVIEQLREAWDQAIADFIFPVLGRFDNTIKGNSLFKIAVLTDADVETITKARGRLSEGLHAPSEALNPETVTHDELVNEIGKLETWVHDIQQRQKDAKKD